MECSPSGSSVHGDSPDKNTGVGCHALLQGIFPTQGLNLRLLHLLQWHVVYGGGVIEAVGDIFLEKILAEVDRYCMTSIRPTVTLKKAALGDDSVLYGALSMIQEA